MLLIINMFSPNNTKDAIWLSNYTDKYIKDTLARVKGVSNAQIMGELKYAMRVWLDPARLAAFR